MKLNLVPEKVIPARHEIIFWEDQQHEDLLAYPQPYETVFCDDVKTWLDENDPDWSVTFDRGDFGEGPAEVTLSFTAEEVAKRFHEKWNQGRCQSISYTRCPNMQAVGEKDYSCKICGKTMRVILPGEWLSKAQSAKEDSAEGQEDDIS
jgi:hypothetical protein